MVGKNPSAARNQVWKRMNEFTGYTGDKPFSCLQCDYWCSTSGHLKTHRITQHRTSSGLKKHEITHTGDKPFSCSICDYKCRYSSQLKTHERTSTGEKTLHLPQVLLHILKINSFEEAWRNSHWYCDYKCSTSGHLNVHKRARNFDKPFSCSQCDFKHSTSGHLKRH